MGQWNRDTYGPISEGVTGSDGGGGRLMSVGVVMLKVLKAIGNRSRAEPWICVSCVSSFDRKVSLGRLLSSYPGVSILAVAYETHMRKPPT